MATKQQRSALRVLPNERWHVVRTSTRKSLWLRASIRASRRGFTLPEFSIAIALFVLVSGGMLAAWLYGARMHALAYAKLTASDQGRALIARFTHDVRTATEIRIGNGDLLSFATTPQYAPRAGGAVQIFPTSDTNNYILYYLDGASQCLKWATNGATQGTLLADSLTNSVIFTAEDPWGNVTTNEPMSEIFGMTLQFSHPIFLGGNGQPDYKDYFQLTAKANKRTS